MDTLESAQEAVMVAIAQLDLTGSPRLGGVDGGHVAVLSELEPRLLPPVLVHRATFRVIDGVHRVHAAIGRGESFVRAVFADGDQDEAFIQAVRLNVAHGLPLSLEERRAAGRRILGIRPQWSDRMIAGIAGLSPNTVGRLRRLQDGPSEVNRPRVGRDGRVYRAAGGTVRAEASSILADNPTITVRELARSLGVSVGLAHSVRRAFVEGRQSVAAVASAVAAKPLRAGERAPARRAGSSVRRRRPAAGTQAELVRALAADPSLRGSERGRALLRMLLLHMVDPTSWAELAAAVPEHRMDAVAALAESLSQSWRQFAGELRDREPPAAQ